MSEFKIAFIAGYPKDSIKKPVRGTASSAGLDFFLPGMSSKFRADLFIMNSDKLGDFILDEKGLTIKPGKKIVIPSGIKVSLPQGHAMIAFEKSGLATKSGIRPTAKVVDEDYQGVVGMGVENTGDKPYTFKFGEKVTQFLVMPVCMYNPEIVEEDVLYGSKSSRGAGAYGSTGR